jgi:hypothetical protein
MHQTTAGSLQTNEGRTVTRDRQAYRGWNEQRVERLLLELFSTRPATHRSVARPRGTAWLPVAVCAVLLFTLVPAFNVPKLPVTAAESEATHEMLAVAELAVDEDTGELESAAAEVSSDEETGSETSAEDSESSST